MKIAITSTSNTLKGQLDSRFARCSYFVIYDTETRHSEIVINPNKDVEEGAGPAAVRFIASYGVSKVVSGEFGMKIKSLLLDLKIQMIMIKEAKSIREIIELLNH
ncbi:NifB/NifX family molybdenum-iron cluster-binding protein [uncultured Bacteroides sp.]|uniref:NifB/NifX family molybdenum-iron cluster-binding protein n=1 Tax=uncultured Bacteroides sp. TaxID=162156 RepID=UPI002AA66079|nr:NifB/NifX family molybdenum-iron cluster-binding protein [uncultured Bacteroides sp.]